MNDKEDQWIIETSGILNFVVILFVLSIICIIWSLFPSAICFGGTSIFIFAFLISLGCLLLLRFDFKRSTREDQGDEENEQ